MNLGSPGLAPSGLAEVHAAIPAAEPAQVAELAQRDAGACAHRAGGRKACAHRSDQPVFGKRVVPLSGHDEVVDDADVDERQAGLQLLGDPLIRHAGFQAAAGVVVRQGQGRSPVGKCLFQDLSGIHADLGERPPKELLDSDQPMLGIQVNDEEDLVVQPRAMQAQPFGQLLG